MSFTHTTVHRCFAGFLLVGATFAPAAAQVTERQPATKEEYAACLDAGEAIDERKAAVTKQQEEHERLAKKFQAADAALNEQVKRHPPRTKPEMQSYNKAIEKRNLAVKDFNERTMAIQREQTGLNALIVRTNSECGLLPVSFEVKEAVENERKARAPKQ